MKKPIEKKKFDQLFADAETKRSELAQRYKCKVNVAILTSDEEDEPCIAYFKAATTFTKMQCMDMATQSPMKASATMFDATVIREASDPRVFVQDNDDDAYYLGAVNYCGELIKIARYLLKKK